MATDYEPAPAAAGARERAPASPGPQRPEGAQAGRAEEIAEQLAAARRHLAAAARRAGRSPSAVTLVAVSKGVPAADVAAARAAGQADFGESRAQELTAKAERLGRGLRWHFVGRLQRNKVPDVIGLAGLIHSVDRFELADTIAERARGDGRVQRVLVQVNVGGDPAKGGCAPDDTVALIARLRTLGGIACQGLMTIPPLGGDPRPLFRQLRDLRDDVRGRFPEVQHLSMGMTHDFEVAVEEGATIVRLGEAIFGARAAPADRGK